MVVVFLANGFEEVEALATVDLLRRAEAEVVTVGIENKAVCGAHGIKVVADITDTEFIYDNQIEMVVLPGGMPGTTELEKAICVNQALENAQRDGKWIAAICAAPSILGHKGFLRGKKACCYPGFEEQLIQGNAVSERVVQDDNIITARGAGCVFEFAAKLIEVLKGKEAADKVSSDILCKK